MVPSSRWAEPFASVVTVLTVVPGFAVEPVWSVVSVRENTAPLTGSLDQRPWPGWPM